MSNELSEKDDAVSPPTQAMLDHFATSGFRKLCLHMIYDAVNEIAKNPDSAAGLEQYGWLTSTYDGPGSAVFAMEGLSGSINEGGLDRLIAMMDTPEGRRQASRLMRVAMDNYERLFERDEDSSSTEHQLAAYRSAARAH